MLWNYKKCQKIGLGKGLGRVRAKNLLSQKPRTKNLEQNGVIQ